MGWIDETVSVKQLYLDLQNPRLPQYVKDHNDVSAIRDYLLKKEDVMRIAKNIANNGYHRSAVAIVTKENGKLVVLDGNRRLAACQFILNPKLATDSKDIREFERLKSTFDASQLDTVKITIASSRKEAEKEIWDIHVNQLLKPWQVLQKLRMYRNLINSGDYTIATASTEYGITKAKFEKELSKLYFHEKILERLTEPEDENELLDSGFNKIDRLILSENGKKLLEYEIDHKGDITIKNQKDFDDKLKKLIPYVIDPQKVNAQATQKELVDTVYSKIDPKKFSGTTTSAKPAGKSATPATTPTTPASSTSTSTAKAAAGTTAKKDWITDSEYKAYKGADKVKTLFKELKDTVPSTNRVICTIAVRILAESALYFHLEKTGHVAKMLIVEKARVKAENVRRATKGTPLVQLKANWSPSFREMLDYITDGKNSVVSDALARTALIKVVKGETNFVEDLNQFIHNVHYMPTKDDPEKIWCQFGRLLFQVMETIK